MTIFPDTIHLRSSMAELRRMRSDKFPLPSSTKNWILRPLSDDVFEIHIYMAKLFGSGAESPGGNPGGGSKGATTFVQADSTCFRDLVQRLTGPPVNEPMAAAKAPKKPTAKLHERRQLYARPKIEVPRPATSFKLHQLPPATYSNQVQSPSPSSILRVSPISCCSPPVAPYPHSCGSNKRVSEAAGESLEEKGTKEKRFYLHPSPRSKPRLDSDDTGACTVSAQPKLLTLFPLTSPTAADTKFP